VNSYNVIQVDDHVVLTLFRGDTAVQVSTITWIDIGFINCMLLGLGSAKAVNKQFKLAHKEGKKRVDNLNKLEGGQ